MALVYDHGRLHVLSVHATIGVIGAGVTAATAAPASSERTRDRDGPFNDSTV